MARDGVTGVQKRSHLSAVALLGAVVVAGVAGYAPAQASAPHWSVVASPNVTAGGAVDFMTGVSCTSTTFCVSVGWATNSSETVGVIERWTGSSWGLMTAPSTGDDTELLSVHCSGTTFCVAVGFDGSATLVERWNGGSWAVMTSAGDGELYGVSCAGMSFCMAVGENSSLQTEADEWTGGTSWSSVFTPNSTTSDVLQSVACTGSAFCMATGVAEFGGFDEDTLAERWNGSTWTLLGSPDPDVLNDLNHVSCATRNFCMGVGSDGDGSGPVVPLAEQWNGTTWTEGSAPSERASSLLAGVRCLSTVFCMAVGLSYNNTVDQTLAESWTGSAWSIVPSADTSSAKYNELSAVSCTSATFCMAVGEKNANVSSHTLAEKYSSS